MPTSLNVGDALSFLDAIKKESVAHDEPHIYNEFLNIMKEFKAKAIDTPTTMERVKRLFDGYPELSEKFKIFAPNLESGNDNDAAISRAESESESKSAADSDLHDQDAADIVAHLKKLSLKDEVAAQPEKQTVLHETIQAYEDKRIDTQDVVQRATELFEGHDELIMQFNSLLIVS
ncbi:hypothetical protein HMN09_00395600 [Mycena chlorophos]|uniref:Uncharacterized protein n=1 Tax=Mycena chlorophos TaxID=658473 RepID=A0A8H6TJ20_MYCCL|nr:hypothetical protein HMN09_00395600 [Mycena chlorophos]